MKPEMEGYKNLPSVDKLLSDPEIKPLITAFNRELVKYAIHKVLERCREEVKTSKKLPPGSSMIDDIRQEITMITGRSLRPVINATGIIIHTNIGRAPLGKDILLEVTEVLKGYNNLEFDLQKGRRGSRSAHITDLLKYLTGAEDVMVVNNNAAAIMLILRTMAKGKEVVISRGELIEIGGSFRLPDIMKASDCVMKEVGTTNKTGITDYEKAISPATAVLLKAHKSNYVIKGFTEETTLAELVMLGKKHRLPVVYDMGSGLLRKVPIECLKEEPDVKQTLSTGVDLVCFSGDKLLGGPQSGIIAGKKKWVSLLKGEPMHRALRVGKTTLAILESTCLHYLNTKQLIEKNPVFRMLSKTPEEIQGDAVILQKLLKRYGIESAVVDSKGQSGGGSLPGTEIESFAIMITPENKSKKDISCFAEKMYSGLLSHEFPVLGVIRKGHILFDVLTIPEEDLERTAAVIKDVYKLIG
jgi:L-seryl-tRNA(Ser) seleniumtransferase